MSRRNEYLDTGVSDDSGAESGYDSEAAEISRTKQRRVKRRKLSHSSASSDDGVEVDQQQESKPQPILNRKPKPTSTKLSASEQSKSEGLGAEQTEEEEAEGEAEEDNEEDTIDQEIDYKTRSTSTAHLSKSHKRQREITPGVIYLSSLPPYLKPSALKNLLGQRGFEPVTRLFLTPASKHKHSSKKNSRQLYTEGWIEFASKKTAKSCAAALNAQIVGGRKGGFYHDDLWNMKYLRGMSWEELMSGIREERREEEGRRDEARRRIAQETRTFVEGVEKGRKLEGMKKKRKMKSGRDVDGGGGEEDVQRVWRQHEVAKDRSKKAEKEKFDPQVESVLSKIF